MGILKSLLGKSGYSIKVEYDVSVEELVERGKYQYVQDDWHSTRFASANYPSPQKGIARLDLQLLSFKGVSIQQALGSLDPKKYRPVTLHELLAFGEQHPSVQMKFSVVAPGTQVQRSSEYGINVPRLGMGGLGRLLDLQPISHDMNGYEWKLAAVAV